MPAAEKQGRWLAAVSARTVTEVNDCKMLFYSFFVIYLFNFHNPMHSITTGVTDAINEPAWTIWGPWN